MQVEKFGRQLWLWQGFLWGGQDKCRDVSEDKVSDLRSKLLLSITLTSSVVRKALLASDEVVLLLSSFTILEVISLTLVVNSETSKLLSKFEIKGLFVTLFIELAWRTTVVSISPLVLISVPEPDV